MRDDQPDAREGWAGPHGVAERFVVPLKPDNAGGGKGPQFKTDAIRGEEPGDWATYQLRIVFQKLQMALHATAKAWGLVREPDAGDLHVRFDERGVETGATGELVRHRQTKGAATDMSGLKPPAPHSDSTDSGGSTADQRMTAPVQVSRTPA